jgi:hypothetical protein
MLMYVLSLMLYSFREYTSSSACSANTPFEAVWMSTDRDDDLVTLDDGDIFTVSCIASTFEGYSEVDDDGHDDMTVATYSASVYVSISTNGMTSPTVAPTSGPLSLSCFASSETVTMADGTIKAISAVLLGDSILSSDSNGNVKFSNVIAVPHDRNKELATFTQLSTAFGDIKLTADHLIMVDPACNGVTALKAASSVEPGMCLVGTSGSATVESTKTVQGRGIYTVVTEEEFVVVNGFVASPFAVNHAVANAYYNVIRAVPALMHFDVVKQASALFGSLALSASA